VQTEEGTRGSKHLSAQKFAPYEKKRLVRIKRPESERGPGDVVIFVEVGSFGFYKPRGQDRCRCPQLDTWTLISGLFAVIRRKFTGKAPKTLLWLQRLLTLAAYVQGVDWTDQIGWQIESGRCGRY